MDAMATMSSTGMNVFLFINFISVVSSKAISIPREKKLQAISCKLEQRFNRTRGSLMKFYNSWFHFTIFDPDLYLSRKSEITKSEISD